MSAGGAPEFLTANIAGGLLIIHGLPATLSFVPLDALNDAYNVGGTVTVGVFDCVDQACRAATQQYPVSPEQWEWSAALPFAHESGMRTEVHVPQVEGHKILRHGHRWK